VIAVEELQARTERLRTEARQRGLAGALVFSWRRGAVAWFTGYRPGYVTNQVAFWVPSNGDPVLAPRFAFDAARAGATGFPLAPGVDPAMLPPAGATIGLVARDLAVDERSVSLMEGLAGRGIETTDLGPVVDRWRATKSVAEIEAAADAGRLGSAALAAAGEVATVGEIDFEIVARVEAAARRLGAYRVGCLIGVGDGAVVTEAIGRRVGEGDGVGLEVTLETAMGCTHVTHTLAPVPMRPVDRRAEAICRETRAILLRSMRPGTSVDAVVAAGDAILDGHGLLPFKEYDFGHGVGMETPEIPRLIGGTAEVVAIGMTISVHVSVRRPAGETAFFGGPVVIEADGPRELVPDAPWHPVETAG
jgi:Xaa-Pro aminopeptidase